MIIQKHLIDYYKRCLYEEAKVSAFSNLNKDKSNEVIQVKAENICISGYHDVVVHVLSFNTALNMSVKAKLQRNKQLVYGNQMLEGKLYDGTVIYTPLAYCDCTADETCLHLDVRTFTLNIPALLQCIPSNDDKDIILEQLAQLNITFPLSNEKVEAIQNIISSVANTLGSSIKIINEDTVILANINKGLAGVIKELKDMEAVNRTPSPYLKNTAQPIIPSRVILNDSQVAIIKEACTTHGELVAVTGAPGTGKSELVSALAKTYLYNGKKVLVCSKTNTAVDVLYDKLTASLCPSAFMRTGSKEYQAAVADKIEQIVDNDYLEVLSDVIESRTSREIDLYNTIDLMKHEQEIQNNTIKEARKALNKGNFITRFFRNKRYLNLVEEQDNTCRYLESLESSKENGAWNTSILDNCLRNTIAKARINVDRRFMMLLYARELRKGVQPDPTLFKTMLETSPCWLTTTTSIADSIPLEEDLFDLAIIDEASQCDIATCIPILYRAKKIVVVGDNKQLKYMSFIPTTAHNAALKCARFSNRDEMLYNYKNNSMFDLAYILSGRSNILKQQYRGCGEIMNFALKKFYNGVVTNPMSSSIVAPVLIRKCNSSVDKNGVNKVELERVLSEVKLYTNADGRTVKENEENIRSIGILSPFNSQVKAIEKAIKNEIPTELIEKYNITVGTAHAFQGEEKDLMIMSWTVADNSPIQQQTFINNKNLFNVAVTRANKRVINFVSIKHPTGLLKEYVEYCENLNSEEVVTTNAD